MRQRSLLRKNHHAREIGMIDIDYSMGVLSRLNGNESLLMVMDVLQIRDFDEFEGVFGSLQRGRSPYDGDHGQKFKVCSVRTFVQSFRRRSVDPQMIQAIG